MCTKLVVFRLCKKEQMVKSVEIMCSYDGFPQNHLVENICILVL